MTTAFVTCCALIIGVPLGAQYLIVNSEVEQKVDLDVGAGTILVTRPGRAVSDGVVDRLADIPEGSRIQTDDGSQATLSFYSSNNHDSIGSAQIYGGTAIRLTTIRSPRFASSPRGHRIVLDMTAGRVRVSISPGTSRPLAITLQTPQGLVLLDQMGSYSVEVNGQETQVTVREGQATALANGGATVAKTNQRTVMPTGKQPLGALPPERNLLASDGFAGSLGTVWSVYQNQYDPADRPGLVDESSSRGRPAAHFLRDGRNWGQIGLRQELNRDVRDIRELRLHLAALILQQDLTKCGSLGSECPVMAKIEFLDTSGTRREWLQGFYSDSNFLGDVPTSCVTCPPPTGPHIRIPKATWYIYDSPNLIDQMNRAGLTPASIISISIYASGHLFESMVSEVELLALE
ncbi:MAG: hypothetical protein HY023_18775 [Chloroflexi bacterium]|nr:hypothetical protein [Chloroflexota bacterium]